MKYLLAAVVAAMPVASMAQSVVVRGGEHGDFTRLVFSIPRNTVWDVEPNADKQSATVRFGKSGLTFNTKEAFARITRDRVTGLTPAAEESAVEIQLGCDCDVTPFLLNGRYLVLDVGPAAEKPAEQRQAALTLAPTVARPAPVPVLSTSPLTADFSAIRVGRNAGVGPTNDAAELLQFGPRVPRLDQEVAAAETVDPDTPPPSILGEQIAQNLAVAATRGLLDAAHLPEILDPNQGHSDQDTHVAATSAPAQTADPILDAASLLSNVTKEPTKPGFISVGGESCIQDRDLKLAKWVKGDADVGDVSVDYRGRIFGEFDRVNEKFLKKHVQSLLHFGFGAEARQALLLGKDNAMLRAMSYIVDGEDDPTDHFKGQAVCDGYSALWAVADPGSLPPGSDVNQPAVLRAFESLPRHLREYLGPKMAKNLAEAGYTSASADMLRRLERMTGTETNSIALGKARLDVMAGKTEEAQDRLRELATGSGPEAVDALTASIELANATGEAVPDRIVELTAAYATEHRNDAEKGPQLWQAHVRSLLANGQFDTAFKVLKEVEGIPEEMREDTRTDALESLVAHAGDLTFLKIAYAEGIQKGKWPNKLLAQNVARRMLDLGLPEAALHSIDLMGADNAREVRLIKAQALLDLSRPEEAEITLIGLSGDDITPLRAEARRQMGDHEYARLVYNELGAQSDALQSAWLSGDWQNVQDSEDATFSPAAALIQNDGPQIAAEGVTLRDAAALFDASENSRETLRALLDATRITDEN